MPIPSCSHYCSSIIELKEKDGDASRSFFIVQDCFDYPEVFISYENKTLLFKVSEVLCWDFNGDCIESIDCFW